MKTNKPEVAGFISEVGIKKLREDEYTGDWTLYAGPVRNSVTPLIRLSDYEALQAECEELRTALAESRANDLTAMGYLNQIRQLVGGDDFPDMVRRCEKLQAECEKLRNIISDLKDWDCDVSGGFLSIPLDLRRRMQEAIDVATQETSRDD